MAENTIERVAEDLAEFLDDKLPESAHVILELLTGRIYFSDASGKRWVLKLEEAK